MWYNPKHLFLIDNGWCRKYLPICASVYTSKYFEARNFLAKEFHGDGHEQATVVSVAAGGIHGQEYQQEEDYDDGDNAAFGHAAAHFNKRGQR